MFLPDTFIDQVRGSVSIVQVISEYVSLKKRGKNYMALCPFHSEKTPSFNVNEEKQIFHCFGCNTGGDVFKFVTLIERSTFPEAVKRLAEKCGIVLPRLDNERGPDAEVRDAVLEILEAACHFFHKNLIAENDGKQGYNYLLKRGITDETTRAFRIGYAPQGDKLFKHLREQGFPADLIERSGLARRSEKEAGSARHESALFESRSSDGGWYDYFRSRVIFPICDLSGRVVAFGGRSLGDAVPKYLNSPETIVYNKGRNLFGLNFAKESIRDSNFAILVEGYLDFLTPYQSGITNIVASLGTALTEHQVRLMGRFTRNVIVNYDSDSAGLNAAKRSLEFFLGEGFKVNVLVLPEGKDPDLYVREFGGEKYRASLRSSVPYIEFIAENAFKAEKDVASARGKINVLNSVLPYLARVANKIERSAYAARIAHRIGIDDELILAELRKAVETQKTKLEEDKIVTVEIKPAEGKMLRTLLENPELCRELWAQLSLDDFAGLRTEKIFKAVLDLYHDHQPVNYANLKRLLDEEELKLLMKVYFQEDVVASTPDELVSCLSALKRSRLEVYMKQLQAKIVEAEKAHDEEKMLRFYQQKREITQQLYTLYQY